MLKETYLTLAYLRSSMPTPESNDGWGGEGGGAQNVPKMLSDVLLHWTLRRVVCSYCAPCLKNFLQTRVVSIGLQLTDENVLQSLPGHGADWIRLLFAPRCLNLRSIRVSACLFVCMPNAHTHETWTTMR
jgi:hypothetical protein